MEFKDAVTQLFERSNAMQSYRGFYITIVGALLAFFGAARRSRRVTQILSGVFIVIAIVNLDGIRDVAKQRVMLRCLLEKTFVAVAPPNRVSQLRGEGQMQCDHAKRTPESASSLLTVASQEVVPIQATDWWIVTERRMSTVEVIEVQVGGEPSSSFFGVRVGEAVRPFA
jgi:hypothetical protein